MAETKTYKGKKQGIYDGIPGGHQARGLGEYYLGPFDTTHGFDLQNAPVGGNKGQFGADKEKRNANPPATK